MTTVKTKSIADWCRDALDIQNACNPLAVARFYVRATDALRDDHGIRGTEDICNHPVTVLIAGKLASLSGMSCLDSDDCAFAFAYLEANRIITESEYPA